MPYAPSQIDISLLPGHPEDQDVSNYIAGARNAPMWMGQSQGMEGYPPGPRQPMGAPEPQMPTPMDAQAEQMYASVQPNPVDQYMTMGRQMAHDMANDTSNLDAAYELSVAARTGRNVGEVLNEQKARRINAMNALTAQVNSEIAAMNAMKEKESSSIQEALFAAGGNQEVAQELMRQKMMGSGATKPITRVRYAGGVEIQEELGPDGRWSEFGRRDRYKPAGTTIVVGGNGETPSLDDMVASTEAEYAAKKRGENVVQYEESAGKLRDHINTIREMRGATQYFVEKKGKPGPLAPAMQTIQSLAEELGIPVDPGRLASGDQIARLSKEMAMGKIGIGGIPAQNFSNADLEFVRRSVANLSSTAPSIMLALNLAEMKAQRQMELAREWYSGRYTKYRSFAEFQMWADEYNEQNPLFAYSDGSLTPEGQKIMDELGVSPQAGDSYEEPALNEGEDGVYEDAEGNRMILKDGIWEPVDGQ